MSKSLSSARLVELFSTVFAPKPDRDKSIAFIVDVPNASLADNDEWRGRREMTFDWFEKIKSAREALGFDEVNLLWYENVGKTNADLPATMYTGDFNPSTMNAEMIKANGQPFPLHHLYKQAQIIVAPTELSATAPLKIAAREFGFRGTTMPGFTASMLPSLDINYREVHEMIMKFKKRLDVALRADVIFKTLGRHYHFTADLRYRTATPSSGILHHPGVVGNLPSGEAYIVPYEGENPEVPSETFGELPVQFGDEIVVYFIEKNRALRVTTEGPVSRAEQTLLDEEPAYGNIAEVGLGILGKFGMKAAGNILMDEKLGLHIAFGRSDHFGGITSPASFKNPKNVVHIDRVYVPSLQPDIVVRNFTLIYAEGTEVLMHDNEWVI